MRLAEDPLWAEAVAAAPFCLDHLVALMDRRSVPAWWLADRGAAAGAPARPPRPTGPVRACVRARPPAPADAGPARVRGRGGRPAGRRASIVEAGIGPSASRACRQRCTRGAAPNAQDPHRRPGPPAAGDVGRARATPRWTPSGSATTSPTTGTTSSRCTATATARTSSAWSVLAAWAEATSTIEIGPLVSASATAIPNSSRTWRAPSDHVSGGRVMLGLGAGWFRRDYDEYGYEFGTVGSGWAPSRSGMPLILHRLERLNPPPVRRMPILIAGVGEQRTLRLVARVRGRLARGVPRQPDGPRAEGRCAPPAGATR